MRWLILLALLALAAPAAAETAQPLTLSEVLRAAAGSHPLIFEAAAERRAAEGKRLGAEGSFDLKLKADVQHAPYGEYDRSRGSVGFEQLTPWRGIRVTGKYENGADFPVYEGGSVTSRHGEASLGVLIPLLRDAGIDNARFGFRRPSSNDRPTSPPEGGVSMCSQEPRSTGTGGSPRAVASPSPGASHAWRKSGPSS